ncbi:RagB/SusD family nutrient uptake outer membrane protein [Parabacteroides faecis]|uniref:RagB/SusD family nutrient uptake outer membrane protein n=1 Tax=Parabacteroides faecis TaxID=1217282 RepID=UPI0021645CAE|nr:RagB/SusD family nutrient uptake outer membrane protein [Parabacteroides faecis]MCS2891035.1 RagB/SusD family nutrient uptake outer membrane protein [Parabacteroides faecis]UVQ45314.1 RagB/SusD family nutrient uptake outer membrane protein [Parabacteroides faecis]
MNKYSHLFICLFVLLFGSSCGDLLNQKPVSSITNESFWTNESDATGVLTGAYIQLRSMTCDQLFTLGESRSEVVTKAVTGDIYERYYKNTLSQELPGPDWSTLYSTVNTANLLIKYIPRIDATEMSRNNLLAEAYTLRAYLYFVLVRTWGGVPLRVEPTEGYNPETVQKGRATEEEVFRLIKEDLDNAIALYHDNTFWASRNRFSKPCANALKADVYLWTAKRCGGGNADLETALAACNEVQQADVMLLPNFGDLFEYNNKCNDEVIMSVANDIYDGGDNYFKDNYSGIDGSSTDPVDGEVIGTGTNGMAWTVSDLVKNQFMEDDSRKAPSFTDGLRGGENGEIEYPALIRKGRGIVQNGHRYFRNDFVLYRLADVLLMKAEAKNALGQDPSEEMNLIRKRAYGDNFEKHIFVSRSKELNDEEILKERLLELVFEGKRWWDLVRFGKAFDIVPSLNNKKGQDHMLLWPLSLNVLTREPQVGQTPGWGD